MTEILRRHWSSWIRATDWWLGARAYAGIALVHAWTSLPVSLGPSENAVLSANGFPIGIGAVALLRAAVSGLLLLLAAGRLPSIALFVAATWHLLLHHAFWGTGWQVDVWLFFIPAGLLFTEPLPSLSAPKASALLIPGIRFWRYELAALYGVSALGKWGTPAWRDGEAIASFVSSPLFHFPNLLPAWSFRALGWAVILTEAVLSAACLTRSARVLTSALAIALHGAIFFLTEIRVFSAALLVVHFALWRELRAPGLALEGENPPRWRRIFVARSPEEAPG